MSTYTHTTGKRGSLEVICGPMFSGKSEELIRRLRRAKIAKQRVGAFKHALDDRSTIEHVISHNGSALEAYATDDESAITKYAEQSNFDVIGIDEVQFFSNDIIPVICELVNSGKRVIIAGFDTDFRTTPMGPMPTLLAIADKVCKLQAICTECGQDATLTQRLVNGKPAKYSGPIVLIGGQEAYQARCRSCHVIDEIPQYAQRTQTSKEVQT